MAYVHTIRTTRKGILSYCAKRDEQIAAYSAKGWSRIELAEKYNLTPQRVGQILQAKARKNRRQKKAS
jgi:Mor family transcriptional regulator